MSDSIGNVVNTRSAPMWMPILASGSLLVVATILAISRGSLYGDGAYYLVSLISGDLLMPPNREPATFIRHLPVIAAIKWGISNTSLLSLIMSLTYVFVPLLIWISAFFIASTDNAKFLLITYMSLASAVVTWLFSVSELVLGIPAVVVASLILSSRNQLCFLEKSAAITLCFLVITTHEALALCSVLILSQVILRRRFFNDQSESKALTVVAALCLLNLVWSLSMLIDDLNPNSKYFFDALFDFTPFPVAAFTCLVMLSMLSWTAVLSFQSPPFVFVAAGLISLMAVLSGLLLAPNFLLSPYFSYVGRAWILVLACGTQILFMWLFLLRCKVPPIAVQSRGSRFTYLLSALAPLLVLWIPLSQAYEWTRAQYEVRNLISMSRQQFVDPEISLSSSASRYMWGWTNPSLGLILRQSPSAGVLLPPQGWTPFDPSEARKQISDNFTWRALF